MNNDFKTVTETGERFNGSEWVSVSYEVTVGTPEYYARKNAEELASWSDEDRAEAEAFFGK